jgi:beta-lactamase class A
MTRIYTHLFICSLISFLLPVSVSFAAITYDVSYFWGNKQQYANTYASKVKQVLGPNIAKQIKVVRNAKGQYGVIYNRDGNYQTAHRVAMNHAKLLRQAGVTKAKGYDAAYPIPDQQYPSAPSKKPPSKQRPQPQQLDTTLDSNLEANIDRYIKRLRFRGALASTDRTSFVVYDVTKQKKVVSINEDQTMMAASLIKNFIMLAYFHEVKHKRLEHTAENRRQLRQMIQRSANTSTNYFIRLLGGPRGVERILRWNYPYFKQTRIVEYIPNGGRTYRNMTSAHELNKFYNQLWLGNLPYSSKMKYYLGLPNGDRMHDKTCIPSNVRVYHKTGTVYGLVADSGILAIIDSQGKQRAYIFTGIIEDRTKTSNRNRSEAFWSWVGRRSDTLRRVSEAVYEYIYEVHYGGQFDCRRHAGQHLKR